MLINVLSWTVFRLARAHVVRILLVVLHIQCNTVIWLDRVSDDYRDVVDRLRTFISLIIAFAFARFDLVDLGNCGGLDGKKRSDRPRKVVLPGLSSTICTIRG